MNIHSICLNEVINSKLMQKQTKILSQIDCHLNRLFEARRLDSPIRVGLKTESEIIKKMDDLIYLRKQCLDLATFGNMGLELLEALKIEYKE